MADREPNAPSEALNDRRPKVRPSAAQLDLLLHHLRGVPDGAPTLPEALSLRDSGWHLVVAYCRISNDRHKRDGHGVSDQANHCARIAAKHRLIVVHRYVDNDKSASKAGVERPEFDDMLDALKNGSTAAGYPVDGVVCVSDDRLYRDVHTFQRFLACLQRMQPVCTPTASARMTSMAKMLRSAASWGLLPHAPRSRSRGTGRS
ncbi:recombinase family protein [Streptomyces chartreusis]|uniref:recombinase family protein n=1 Tax=Streptomyces chartreusis TaxID=1969 RepID=UPI003D8CA75C